MTLQLIVFIVLALFIAVCSVLAVTNLSAVRFIWYSRYLLPTQLLILGSCTITDLRRWYNSALCI